MTYSGRQVADDDVLAVLGVADADLLFGAVDAVAAHDSAGALRAAARLADTGRDLTQFAKDLEGHARELLVVQTLGEVPAELRVTPERDERLAEQAARVGGSDVVRLLDLLAAALRAVKDGADARTQLELALVKAAAPEVDPSARALHGPHRAPRGRARRSRPGDGSPGTACGPCATPGGCRRAGGRPCVHGAGTRGGRHRSRRPRSAAAPAALADPPPGELSLAGFTELWPAVLDAVRADNQLLGAILSSARPVELRGSEIVIAFDEGQGFERRKADARPNRVLLEGAIRALHGTGARVCFEVRARGEQAVPAPPPSDDELVARFVAEFDAEEIDAELIPRI